MNKSGHLSRDDIEELECLLAEKRLFVWVSNYEMYDCIPHGFDKRISGTRIFCRFANEGDLQHIRDYNTSHNNRGALYALAYLLVPKFNRKKAVERWRS